MANLSVALPLSAVKFPPAGGKQEVSGAAYVNCLVDPTNTRAIALYQGTGFIAAGMRDALIEMRINVK